MKVLLAAVNDKYIPSKISVYSLKAYARQYREAIEITGHTIHLTIEDN